MSTMSPRFLSSRFADTTAVELNICALRATTTPVLLLLASVLHPASDTASSTNEPANKEPLRSFNSICFSRVFLLSRRSRSIIVTQLSQQIALRLAPPFAYAQARSETKWFDPPSQRRPL